MIVIIYYSGVRCNLVSPGFTPQRVVDLASRYRLLGYDALHSHLARSLGLPLATLDHWHRQAARAHNVTLFALA
jgi:predicted nucleic acid-binding protein